MHDPVSRDNPPSPDYDFAQVFNSSLQRRRGYPMKAFYCFALLAIFLLIPALAFAADPPKELETLNRLAGKWEKEFEVTTPGQTPEKVKKTGTHASEWILNNRHLQEKGKDSDGTTYLSVYSYDEQAKQFKSTFFQSTGFTTVMLGSFDAVTNTFTFKRKIENSEFIGTNQSIDADNYKMHFELKRSDGTIVWKLTGTAKRVKP